MTKTLIFFITIFCFNFESFPQDPVPDSTKTQNNSKNIIKVDTTEDETEFQSTEQREKLPSWSYSIGIDGTTSSGNVNRQLLNLKSTLNFENPKSIFGFFMSPKFQYGTNSDQLQEREIFLDLNSTLFYSKHNVYMLFFGTYEQSNLRKISNRYNVGIGIGWKILGGINSPKSKVKLSVSNAFVHESTNFEFKEKIKIYRNSTRVKLRIDFIQDKFFIQSVAFLQPSLTDNYYRWNSSSQLSYKVGKHIIILASLENTNENFNVLGIQNSQTNTTFGLVYSSSN